MKELPDQKNLTELVKMGKSFEEQTRKLYEMAEAFAQKWERRLEQENSQMEKQQADKN